MAPAKELQPFKTRHLEELEKMDWEMVPWSQLEICLPERVTK
jgi:hypothetical protein